jgi:UDP-sulfoquinovose synthase
MKVLIVGGDGFCGWPTALKFASEGWKVTIIDNLSRRLIDEETSSNSLVKISSISKRIQTARQHIGEISFVKMDVAKEYERLCQLIREELYDTVIHFGEQRSAPYSMIDDYTRNYTVDNNLIGTHNICSALVRESPQTHLIHLGTMGVYGYNKEFGPIPEGYLDVQIKSTRKSADILYPANPGSIYHLTKCLDQLVFQFYHKNWGLRITDLHQGIVWGFQTELTASHKSLTNRFDYDGIYGTVLNRFVVQALNDHSLSVYGTGGQTRAFINIEDTGNCVLIAANNPPEKLDQVRIFNQVAETKNVLELARTISEITGAKIEHLDNPRKELAENELEVGATGLKSLGFKPILLDRKLIDDIMALDFTSAEFNSNNINNSPKWTSSN